LCLMSGLNYGLKSGLISRGIVVLKDPYLKADNETDN
jgi:hypothetical protein